MSSRKRAKHCLGTRFTERKIKSFLTASNYGKWLKKIFPHKKPDDDWDPKTGTCGTHNWWVAETLLGQDKDSSDFKLITLDDVDSLLQRLDDGKVLSFLLDYPNGWKTTETLPEDNRYGNHEWIVVKGDCRYYVTQGYLHAYKHRIHAYTRDQIRRMFFDIMVNLADYNNDKCWGDLHLDLYKKYFKTPLFLYPMKPVNLDNPVNGIVLKVDVYD
jgi:hypothetical protein